MKRLSLRVSSIDGVDVGMYLVVQGLGGVYLVYTVKR